MEELEIQEELRCIYGDLGRFYSDTIEMHKIKREKTQWILQEVANADRVAAWDNRGPNEENIVENDNRIDDINIVVRKFEPYFVW